MNKKIWKFDMKTILILAIASFNLLPTIVSADEFGERFNNKTPQGMASYDAAENEIPDIVMDNIAKELQDVMPAAGTEEIDTAIPENVEQNK